MKNLDPALHQRAQDLLSSKSYSSLIRIVTAPSRISTMPTIRFRRRISQRRRPVRPKYKGCIARCSWDHLMSFFRFWATYYRCCMKIVKSLRAEFTNCTELWGRGETKKSAEAFCFSGFWSEWEDSNFRPLEPHSSTLPTALHPDIVFAQII